MRLIAIDICKRGEPIRWSKLQADQNFLINQLCSMMPALQGLKRSVFSPVVVGLEDVLAFGLLLTETPQLELLLSDSAIASERIIRVDPAVLDEQDILDSWTTTKGAIISAGIDPDPTAPALIKSILKKKARAEAARKRRVREDTYLLSLQGRDEKLFVPELTYSREETQIRKYQCQICQIRERDMLRVGLVEEVTDDESSPEKFHPSRKVAALLTGDTTGIASYEWLGRQVCEKRLVVIHAKRVFDLTLNETLVLNIVAVEPAP